MSRRFMCLLAACGFVAVSLAQDVKLNPMPTPPPRNEVPVNEAAMYICKQLDLDAAQWQKADELMLAIDANKQPTAEDIQNILLESQRLRTELEFAQKEGDEAKVKELTEQIKRNAPHERSKHEFIEGLRAVLRDDQKAKLDELVKQTEAAQDLWLQPIEVIRAARAYGLDRDQEQKLEKIQSEFRHAIDQVIRNKRDQERELLTKLINDVANVLDESQRLEFKKKLNQQRPETPRWEVIQSREKHTQP